MIKYQHKRYLDMDLRLRKAIMDLHRSGMQVTVWAVSKKAMVDRKTIYRHREIVDLIKTYR